MKKYVLFFVSLLLSVTSYAQPLRDINYEYLYNPDVSVSLELKPVRNQESYTVLYTLTVKDTTGLERQFTIEWEGRDQLSDKEGTAIKLFGEVVSRHAKGLHGRGDIPAAGAPQFLVARVTNQAARRAWLFYTSLEPGLPVNNFLMRNGSVVTTPYILTDDRVTLAQDANEWMVFYYNDDFPAAAPAFSEALARVSRGMEIDSTYRVRGGDQLSFSQKGLYLLQKDTASLEGFAFRVEDDYPQYTKVVNLSGPLIYISTRQESERLALAKGNKKAFDRIVLSIATETERARILMRNYFRRVELANRYFTSYKEGWKTDRGMVYIIFGKPDEVFRFNDREIWSYDNDQFKISLTFTRSGSLFDPDNFVLIREKKYENTWYEVIDLWRNARF
jgi:GWxTD domain-containing protein